MTAPAPTRALRYDGTNRRAVEQLTGTSTADSVLDETAVVVDAWGAALYCPPGSWVVKPALGPLQVLSAVQWANYRRKATEANSVANSGVTSDARKEAA